MKGKLINKTSLKLKASAQQQTNKLIKALEKTVVSFKDLYLEYIYIYKLLQLGF